MDIIRELGELALATRLKRLSERLARDVTRVYKDQRVTFKARWFAVTQVLLAHDELAITEVADALGLTHPAVNQIATQMSGAGLLKSRKDRQDERRRILSLSAEGRRTARRLEPTWAKIRQANRDLLEDLPGDIFAILDTIEARLDETDMSYRVVSGVQAGSGGDIQVIAYRPHLKRHFKRLNEQWIRKYFTIEAADSKQLLSPTREIIGTGGTVLFAQWGDQIIGTVAVVKHDGVTFEIVKMAVSEAWQGKKVGRRLAAAAIEWIREQGGRRVLIETSPKLKAANALYGGLGFRRLNSPYRSAYTRQSFRMELNL